MVENWRFPYHCIVIFVFLGKDAKQVRLDKLRYIRPIAEIPYTLTMKKPIFVHSYHNARQFLGKWEKRAR